MRHLLARGAGASPALGWRASGDGVLRLQLAEQRKLPGSWAAAIPASSLKIACTLTSGRQWRADPLPVMVWLHGGGFTLGAGGLPAV